MLIKYIVIFILSLAENYDHTGLANSPLLAYFNIFYCIFPGCRDVLNIKQRDYGWSAETIISEFTSSHTKGHTWTSKVSETLAGISYQGCFILSIRMSTVTAFPVTCCLCSLPSLFLCHEAFELTYVLSKFLLWSPNPQYLRMKP